MFGGDGREDDQESIVCSMAEPVYTQDWTRHFVENATTHLLPLAGRPLSYLEIGVFEGRSARWMLENVLTHLDSRMVGLDAWPIEGDPFEERARANLAPFADKVEIVKGESGEVLRDRRFAAESFDVVYVDGDHRALNVLTDSVLMWPLLKVGGICIWDDYGWRRAVWKRAARHERPRDAIDAFLSAIRGKCEVLFRNYQVGVRKTAGGGGGLPDSARGRRRRGGGGGASRTSPMDSAADGRMHRRRFEGG